MKNKRWEVFPKITTSDLKKYPEVHPVILQLLYNRQINEQDKIDEFLNPDYSRDLHDPFIFKDMEKACQRIEQAIKSGEKILVWGDFDADGVTASTLMIETLEKLLASDFDVFIPNREEGYGMNLNRTQEFIDKGVQLIITVDCGISDRDSVKLAAKAGIDVIITDHHEEPLKNPKKAFAIINPQLKREEYPFKRLSGAGVAFKLAQGLIKRNSLGEAFEKWLLDLVAIGTIADMMPILGENRALVKYGLVVMQKTSRIGLREIAKEMNSNLESLTEWQIAWQLGPRLNASGRIDDAIISFELLRTKDQTRAKQLVDQVASINRERQKMTEIVTKEANEKINEENNIEEQSALFAYESKWPPGLIGLVAGRLKEKFHKPFFVITEDKGKLRGSCRSIDGVNLSDALKEVEDLLEVYGGHAAACGFTLKKKEDLSEFKSRISAIVNKQSEKIDTTPVVKIDAEITLEEIDWDFWDILNNFAPYGEGNWIPKYLSKNINIDVIEKIGKDKTHLRLMISGEKSETRKAIGFSMGKLADTVKVHDKVDLVFEVGLNEWKGNRELEIKVVDVKKIK